MRHKIIRSLAVLLVSVPLMMHGEHKNIETGKRYDRLIIRNVILIDGKGTPPRGPVDVILRENRIESIRSTRNESAYAGETHVLDGGGRFLLPGLINIHAHIHDNRGGMPISFQYIYNLWLACGITTVRDVGSNTELTVEERRKSREGTITAPRIYLYMRAGGNTPEEGRRSVQRVQKQKADGIKIFGLDRDVMKVIMEEARKWNLRTAHHVGVEETDAWDDIRLGTASIEHWYGIPDAALHGVQNFPPHYNYSNESDRFRYAGHLWKQADPEKLEKVLQAMVDAGVAWCPTFVIYEANRDLQRAVNQPWFEHYLHPALEKYFIPNPAHHGSFQWDWTTADEIEWKNNFRLWMKAVRRFADLGGVVGVGEDAGYIYMMYGFSLIRELELHQEAGFHPIDVIQNATSGNARILGLEDKLGRIRSGYWADLILVNENPLENMKCLYPTGVMRLKEGEIIQHGGVEWTIKDGILYHAPTLLKTVQDIVIEAR
ncbi:MAG TPA: amidohydrolase [bacterium]|nr:amidohydrolase [bacterium]